jgi:hypothetical protein
MRAGKLMAKTMAMASRAADLAERGRNPEYNGRIAILFVSCLATEHLALKTSTLTFHADPGLRPALNLARIALRTPDSVSRKCRSAHSILSRRPGAPDE